MMLYSIHIVVIVRISNFVRNVPTETVGAFADKNVQKLFRGQNRWFKQQVILYNTM